jgi:acetate---CoA ligase (ADP-forming)
VRPEAALDPARITVVGASNRSTNAGLSFVRALRAAGYAGELTVLNRDGEPVEGAPGHVSWDDLTAPPDLAVIAVPAALAVDALRDAARAGIPAVHLFTGGFAERGTPEGVQAQQELAEIADRAGMVLIGPNGMGLYRPRAGLAFRSDQPMLDGPVALVSQSGGVAIPVVHQLAARGVGIATAVSYGNGAQLAAGWWAEAVARPDEVAVLGVYVESANEPDLADRLAAVAEHTPVVLLGGPGDDAARAIARRHTGSPGGDLREDRWPAGVLRVNSLEHLVSALEWFAVRRRSPESPRVAVVTISGGIGVVASSALTAAGVPMATISERSQEQIRAISPRALLSAANPLDLGAAYLSRKLVAGVLATLRADPGVDLTLFHLMWDHVRDVDRTVPGYADRYLQLLIDHATAGADLAVYFPTVVDDDVERGVRRNLRRAGVPVVETLDVAATVLSPSANTTLSSALASA